MHDGGGLDNHINESYILQSTGDNALHMACGKGLADMVEFLLTHYQLDVNRRNSLVRSELRSCLS